MRRLSRIIVAFVAVMAIAAPAVAKVKPNSPDYWESWAYKTYGMQLDCEKTESGFGDLTYWTADGEYPLVLVKGGPGWPRKYWDVEKGDKLDAPWNADKGRHYGVSYVITCEAKDLS